MILEKIAKLFRVQYKFANAFKNYALDRTKCKDFDSDFEKVKLV